MTQEEIEKEINYIRQFANSTARFTQLVEGLFARQLATNNDILDRLERLERLIKPKLEVNND